MLIQYRWYGYKVYEWIIHNHSIYCTSCWLWSLVHPPCKSLQKLISNLDTAFLAFHISQCSFCLDHCEGLGWADTGKLMDWCKSTFEKCFRLQLIAREQKVWKGLPSAPNTKIDIGALAPLSEASAPSNAHEALKAWVPFPHSSAVVHQTWALRSRKQVPNSKFPDGKRQTWKTIEVHEVNDQKEVELENFQVEWERKE